MKETIRLQKKVRYFTGSYTAFLAVVFLCCILMLYQNSNIFEGIISENYLQSAALKQISEINDLLKAYGNYPDPANQQEIREAVRRGEKVIKDLSVRHEEKEAGLRMLATATERTYGTLKDSTEVLFSIPTAETPDEAFYVCYYETLEIGGYVDTYLKQLMAKTLETEYEKYEQTRKYVNMLPLCLLILVTAAGGVALYLNFWFGHKVIRPVLMLSEAAESMAANRMDIPDLPAGQADEIGTLVRIFNKMKKDCQMLLTAEKKLSESRMAVLRQQINPHFLFNALSLIIQNAMEEEAFQTEELLRRLSLLLRRTIYTKEEWISLKQELETLNSYMYIQEQRFGDRLLFWIDCRVSSEQYNVPAFLMQPLVENAISHGISGKDEGGLVRVKIRKNKDHLSITVTDNGLGMEKNIKDRLNRGEADPNAGNSGIGVLNVAERIRLLDPMGRFRIFSKPGSGTSIRIDLSLTNEEDHK